jgi:hypothetical protein
MRVASNVPPPVPLYQGPTLLRVPSTAKVWFVQLAPGLVTWTVPPLNRPVIRVGMLLSPVTSEKLPPVIVAVVEQEMQSAVCCTSAFQLPGSAPAAAPANLPSVEVA